MKLVRRILNIFAWPFRQAVRPVRAMVPAVPDAPDGIIPGARYRVGFARTMFAPSWRRIVRWGTVGLGFAVYIGLQIGLAYLVNQLWWWYIIAFFIVVGCFALAASKPTFTFIFWLVTSPLGFLFLRLDFGAGIPAITYDRVALSFMCMLLIAQTLVNRYPIRKLIAGEWVILIFVGYTIVSLYVLHPGNPLKLVGEISEKFDHIGLALVVYFVAKSVLKTREHLKWALVGLVITGFYIALCALYEHYTGRQWFNSFMGGETRLMWNDLEKGRAAGPLLNPAALGDFLGITAMLSFHMFAQAQRKAAKLFYVATMLLSIVGCYFSFTRSGYLSFIIPFALMPFLARGYRKQYMTLGLVGLLCVAVVVPVLMSNPQVNRRMTVTSTIYFRAVITASSINIIKHHPWFGVGLGEIDNALQQYITNAGTLTGVYGRGISPTRFAPQQKLLRVQTSHNSFLTIFCEQGLIGGFLFVGSLALFLLYMWRVRAGLPDEGVLGKDYIALLILLIIGHYATTMGYDARFFRYPSYFSWALIALGVRLGQMLEDEKRAAKLDPLGASELDRRLTHA